MAINKNPPARPKFFKNAISCISLVKSEWNIIAVAKENKAKIIAEILAWYPMIIKTGKSISNKMVGHKNKPETPNPSIQFTVASKLLNLLNADNKNTDEIKTLAIKSIKLVIPH